MHRASLGRISVVRQALAICLSLAGCASTITPVALAPPSSTTTNIVSAYMIPAGDTRMVTLRKRSDSLATTGAADKQEILCTEPSPDWATSLARQVAVSASGTAASGATGSLSVTDSTTRTIIAMAGRTAGVVALRDGLYAACQAYANGVIGKDGYALMLSQYGNLLVALAGSSTSAGGGPGENGGGGGGDKTAAPAVAVTIASGATPSTPAKPAADTGKGGSTPAPSNDAILAQMQQQHLQALMAACITENDRTVVRPNETNRLLASDDVCHALMTAVVSKAPALLTPPGGADNPPAPGAGSAPKPNASVAVLQQQLRDHGENLAVDGILGEQTVRAAIAYTSKQPKPAPDADRPPHG